MQEKYLLATPHFQSAYSIQVFCPAFDSKWCITTYSICLTGIRLHSYSGMSQVWKMASLGTTDAAFYRPEAFPLAQQTVSKHWIKLKALNLSWVVTHQFTPEGIIYLLHL